MSAENIPNPYAEHEGIENIQRTLHGRDAFALLYCTRGECKRQLSKGYPD